MLDGDSYDERQSSKNREARVGPNTPAKDYPVDEQRRSSSANSALLAENYDYDTSCRCLISNSVDMKRH